MLLSRRMNTDPFARLSRDMDRLFESMFSSTARPHSADVHGRWFSAPLNLWEDEETIHIEMEVPGVEMKDIEILTTGDELTIKGQREIAVPEDARVLRRERGTGTFERKTSLPIEVDVEKVEATLKDGVLTVKLPKVAARRPRRVEVKALQGK